MKFISLAFFCLMHLSHTSWATEEVDSIWNETDKSYLTMYYLFDKKNALEVENRKNFLVNKEVQTGKLNWLVGGQEAKIQYSMCKKEHNSEAYSAWPTPHKKMLECIRRKFDLTKNSKRREELLSKFPHQNPQIAYKDLDTRYAYGLALTQKYYYLDMIQEKIQDCIKPTEKEQVDCLTKSWPESSLCPSSICKEELIPNLIKLNFCDQLNINFKQEDQVNDQRKCRAHAYKNEDFIPQNCDIIPAVYLDKISICRKEKESEKTIQINSDNRSSFKKTLNLLPSSQMNSKGEGR